MFHVTCSRHVYIYVRTKPFVFLRVKAEDLSPRYVMLKTNQKENHHRKVKRVKGVKKREFFMSGLEGLLY